eukprot:TRINITY_DN64327_c6_g1_i1.p1 TRINITY_DN64327_c6_g1~~TRINITY_DN64327_c6_g1_i1.p1  ORF type:complete len:2209 (+),score=297.78 TRINITY_DN64327_c6_g1_i1:12673-19299(+)
MIYGLFINLFNIFCESDGLESVLEIIYPERFAEKAHALGLSNYRLPLDAIASIIAPFKSIKAIAHEEICKNLVIAGKAMFFQRIETLEEKDIKDMTKESIAGSMALMRSILRILYTDEEAVKEVQAHEMLLSLKFLQSSSLEKRLNGLADIKKLIDRVEYSQRFAYQSMVVKESWLNADYLAKWIIEQKVLETILNENAHAELIRRSAHILTFLAKQKAVTEGIIELLWKCQQDRHEDIIRAVYDTIKETAIYLSPYGLKYIFSKIKSIHTENYDEKLVTFMKDFTVTAYTAHNERVEKMQDIETPTKLSEFDIERTSDKGVAVPSAESLYCTPIFWELLQDDSTVSLDLTELAMIAFKETLAESFCVPYRLQYLYLCMENVKMHKSVPQSLTLALYILTLVHNQKMAHNSGTREWLAQLSKDYNVVDLLLNSFEKYFIATSGQEEDISDKIVVGKHKHSVNLEARLKFLYNYESYGPKEARMKNSDILKLWNLFVENSRTDHDVKTLLKWLGSEKEISGGLVPVLIFNKEQTLYLFDIVCKAREKLSKKYDLFYFKCFSKNFKIVNILNNSLEVKKGKIRIQKIDTLIGLDAVWENVRFCQHDGARAKFNELLIDVYNNLAETLESKRKEILANFINRCMGYIIKADTVEEEFIITNLAKLLLTFFDLMDGNKYKEQEDSDTGFYRYTIVVIFVAANVARKFEVDMDITVGQLRKKIADEFHIPFNGFQMAGKLRVYERDEDDYLLRNVGWSQQIQVKYLPGIAETNPKLLIAENHEYITHLFLLLSKESATYVEPVWELLMTLPPDQKMLSDINALSIPPPAEGGWNALLDTKSIHKFLYALQIIEEMVTPPADMDTVEAEIGYKRWIALFCKKEGLAHLFYAFIELPIVSLHHPLTRKCFGLLLKVLHLIQVAGYPLENHVPKYEVYKEAMVERVLTVLEALAQFSILPEAVKQQKSPKKQRPVKPGSENEEQSSEEKSLILQKRRKVQSEESKIFEHAFGIIKGPKGSNCGYFDQMAKSDSFKGLLLKGLILSDNPFLKHNLATELLTICKVFKNKEYSPYHPHIVLAPFMLQVMVRETLHRGSNSEKFYQILCAIVKDIPKPAFTKIPINCHDLLSAISVYLKERAVMEHTSKETDNVLVGLLWLLEALLEKFSEEREFVGQTCGIIQEVLCKCLFEFPTVAQQKRLQAPPPPKCKSRASRLAAFKLLCVLSKDCPINLSQIVKYLIPIHARGAWRTKRTSDWRIIPEISEKSTTGYVGLKNLGCTCYMNSLLQQLYMIPTFRSDILAVEDPKKEINPEENLLYQTQCLFAALNESVKQYYNPKIFCHAFKDWDGKPINVLEQMDVDEFFNLLMDKIEFAIKGTVQAATIKNHFGGVFANQLLCKDCPHSSVREEPYLALNLQVKNKKSLQQCLESFVEGEMLQGNNAYHCEKCDKKVTTLKRVCIKRLPRHLIFVLKRFDIDYDTMQKFKINDYCEFPMRLNMESFTVEGLAKKDREKERERARKEGRDLDDLPSISQEKPQYPQEYYDYKLTGVVIHMGTADAGHYYSLIMDREKAWLPEKERWYEFNDTVVSQYNSEEIKDDAFGGEEKLHGFEGMSFRTMEKIRNAYLLVYERVTPYDPPEENSEVEEDNTKEKQPEVTKKLAVVPKPIHSAIIQENVKYWYSKYMFHDDYFEFALNLCANWNSAENIMRMYPSKNNDYHLLGLGPEIMRTHGFQTTKALTATPISIGEVEEAAIKEVEPIVFQYASTLALTTLFRAHGKNLVPDFMNLLKAHMNKNVESAQWLLWQFCNSKIICEFLLECTEGEVRRLVVGLLYCAMLKTFEAEKGKLSTSDKGILANFANGMFYQLPNCKKYTIHFEQFFQVFSRLTSLGPEIREYLLKISTLKRLLGFWGSFTETNWDSFSDLSFKENAKPELGLPSEVDERFQSPFEEYFTARREKMQQHAQPLYTFLIEAISLLLRATTIEEKTSVSKLALPGCLKGVGIDSTVKGLVTTKVMSELIKDCRHNIAITELVKAYGHLSWEDPKLKKTLLEAIIHGIDINDYDSLSKYFLFLKEVIAAPDSEQPGFIPIALTELVKILKKNQQAYLATVISVKCTLWLAKEVPLAAEWYMQNCELWSWITDWLRDHPYPSLDDRSIRPYKSPSESIKAMNRYESIYAFESQSKWKLHTKWLEENIGRIKEGTILCFINYTQEKQAR